MLPPIPNFSAVENVSRKRKKPDRDFIDEMLQSEGNKKDGCSQSKRSKTEDSDVDKLISLKSSADENKTND